jgi:tetratricopeptide (TPR) repeat protein
MIYKRLLLLSLLASLSACSSMPSFMTAQNADNVDSETLKNQSTNQSSPKAQSMAISPNVVFAQSLVSQTDLYKVSKILLLPSVKDKVLNALSQFNRGEFEQSEQTIKQILSSELGLSSEVYVLAGDIALANKKRNEAIVNYRQALSVNEHNAKAANRLGMHLREQGRFSEAEKLYTQAINAQPSIPHGYRNRAVLYDLYLNDKAKALQDYKSYLALLNYQLAQQDGATFTDVANAAPQQDFSSNPLSELELKALKTNIKIAKRWLIDVGRQVDVLARSKNNTAASGH